MIYFVISNNLHSTVIAGLNQLNLLSSFVKVLGIDDVKSPKPSIKSLSLLGKSTNEIADTMCLSPRTVGTHLYNIKQKLNANNSAEIALIAIRCGLMEP